jgi:hypothetical protein
VASRRQFLVVAALAGVGAVGGCALRSPAVVGHTTGPRSPSPTGLPHRDEGLATAGTVEAAARGVEQRAEALSLTPPQSALASWTTQAAQFHRAAIVRGTPVATAPGATPSAPPSIAPSPTATWDGLLTTARTSATQYARHATSAEGTDRLTWASLAAFGACVATRTTGSRSLSKTSDAQAPVVPGEVEALAGVVAGIHALVFATELALTHVPRADAARGTITSAWTGWLASRDELSATLSALGGTPPGSQAPYDITAPKDPAAALGLVATLETRFLPTLGVWVAAADGTAPAAIELLRSTAVHAVSIGGELQIWPGWPTP